VSSTAIDENLMEKETRRVGKKSLPDSPQSQQSQETSVESTLIPEPLERELRSVSDPIPFPYVEGPSNIS